MTIHNSTAELIGNTPLIRLNHVTEGIKATIAAKVEYFNPGGSSKDRIAELHHRRGRTQRRTEARRRDRGTDLRQYRRGPRPRGAAARLSHHFHPAGQGVRSQACGIARLWRRSGRDSHRRRSGRPALLLPVADRLAKAIPGGYRPNQYDNPNGPESHYHTTGPEIWEATDHKVTHFVAGIGTGGTISGTGHYLKDVSNGAVQVIGADPEGSIYSDPNDVHQYQIEGVGEDFYPKAFDRSLPDEIVQVTDAEAFEMTRRLANEEGLLVGGSSGMAVFSALKYAREHDLDENQLVVVLMPDSGRSYMEKIFNDDWMRANGFADVVERTTKPSLAEQYL